jgi:hypothetical protein
MLVCQAERGSSNDQEAVNIMELQSTLAEHGLHVMADKGFKLTTNIRAFLKKNARHDQKPSGLDMKALSAVRTAGVEWPFGHLQERFDYLTMRSKNRVLQSTPEAVLQVAIVLHNLLNLMRGTQNHEFFDLDPPFSPEEYVAAALDIE